MTAPAVAPSGPGVYVASPYGGLSDEGSVTALALNTSNGAFSQLRCIAALDAPSGKCGEQSGNEAVLGLGDLFEWAADDPTTRVVTSYIETIPKRGYRLTVPVERLEPEREIAETRRLDRIHVQLHRAGRLVQV